MVGIAAKVIAPVTRSGPHIDARGLFIGQHANDDVIGETENERAVGKLYEPRRILIVFRRHFERRI
jgi:hypothetical protein